MDVVLVVAGVICLFLAFGHATIGLAWVLPGIQQEHLGTSPFGGRTLSAATIHATWHIVTVFALSAGIVLLWLGIDRAADPRNVVLMVFGAMWFGIGVVATWAGIRRTSRLRDVLNLPVPILFFVVSALCWVAS